MVRIMGNENQFIYWFSELGMGDVPKVGGKNASLGEMYANLTDKGVKVPNGFAISAYAYNHYINVSGIRAEIEAILRELRIDDLSSLAKTGDQIRSLIRNTPIPKDLEAEIFDAYDKLCEQYHAEVDVAVRSSATAEDLPDASFAGQQDTFLNIHGHKALIDACRACFASLFTDRAIAYRHEKNFDHFSVALSIGIQKMIRSDLAAAGVMFSIDTESGFKDVVYITGGYGLGENVVQGTINPDEFYVYKPTLRENFKPLIHSRMGKKDQKMVYIAKEQGGTGTKNIPVSQEEQDTFCLNEEEVFVLARWAMDIEAHYSREAGYFKPMDMEWAKDGQSGELFIIQARPETVHSRRDATLIRRIKLEKTSSILAEGMAVGDSIGSGPANVISSAEDIKKFKPGSVLVTKITDPDWVPIMKQASAIVTDQGGRTCHAAIISRELGIPCIVGTGNASQIIAEGREITASCAGGSQGLVYDGILPYSEETIRLDELEMPKIDLYFSQSKSDTAFTDSRYPVKGVGILRMDEVIRDEVKVHSLAALAYPDWKNGEEPGEAEKIDRVSVGWPDKEEYFVGTLSRSIGKIAAAFSPRPVSVLLPDAVSLELDRLIGGKLFRFEEKNPLMGARGASRFNDLDYEEGFTLEMKALDRVIQRMGMKNLAIVFPACRSVKETEDIISLLTQHGLKRGVDGLQYHLLCRTPAQLLDLESLANAFDQFLFDVGEIAQLTLGIDAMNIRVREYYREDHPAVISLLETGLQTAKKLGKPAGLVNISPSKLDAFLQINSLLKADFMVIRPDLFQETREKLIKAKA